MAVLSGWPYRVATASPSLPASVRRQCGRDRPYSHGPLFRGADDPAGPRPPRI